MDKTIINLNKEKKRKLTVSFYLAHHDDETLFYMGLLLFLKKNKNIIKKINIIIFTDILTENTNHNTQKKKLNNFKKVINKIGNIRYKCLNFSNNIVNDKCSEIKELNEKIEKINENLTEIKQNKRSGNFMMFPSKNIQEEKKKEKSKLVLKRTELREKIRNFELNGKLNINYVKYINILDKLENKLNSDIIFTHNKLGEYGHNQHKLVYLLIKILKAGRWKNKLIYTPSNCESEICLVVDKDEKQEFLKMYDFKDTKERKNIWFNQTLKNYAHWADNDFEYYSVLS